MLDRLHVDLDHLPFVTVILFSAGRRPIRPHCPYRRPFFVVRPAFVLPCVAVSALSSLPCPSRSLD